MPSLSQRGILLCVLCSVTTWQNSCHSVASQFDGRSPCDAGLLAVITLPKHTPRNPSAPGRPNVRTAKSFCCGKISITIGSLSVTSYFFAQLLPCPLQQLQHAVAVDLGLARFHADDQSVSAIERAKLGHCPFAASPG